MSNVKSIEEHVSQLKDHIDEHVYSKNIIDGLFKDTESAFQKDFVKNLDFHHYQSKQIDVIDNCKSSIKSIEKTLQAVDKEFEKQSSRIKRNSEEILLRETIAEVDWIREKFNEYCAYRHLKDLYNKVMPAIQGFERNVHDFNKEIEQQKEMIRRFDEILGSKASKFNIDEINVNLRNYLKWEVHSKTWNTIDKRMESISKDIKDINDDIDEMNERITQEIKSAVNKVGTTLKAELKRNTDKGNINKEIVKRMISNKIDIVEFESKLSLKSNITDTESNMKSVDILHNQIKNLIVIILECLNLDITSLKNNAENEKSKLK